MITEREFSIVMAYEAFRICIGLPTRKHPATEVLLWMCCMLDSKEPHKRSRTDRMSKPETQAMPSRRYLSEAVWFLGLTEIKPVTPYGSTGAMIQHIIEKARELERAAEEGELVYPMALKNAAPQVKVAGTEDNSVQPTPEQRVRKCYPSAFSRRFGEGISIESSPHVNSKCLGWGRTANAAWTDAARRLPTAPIPNGQGA